MLLWALCKVLKAWKDRGAMIKGQGNMAESGAPQEHLLSIFTVMDSRVWRLLKIKGVTLFLFGCTRLRTLHLVLIFTHTHTHTHTHTFFLRSFFYTLDIFYLTSFKLSLKSWTFCSTKDTLTSIQYLLFIGRTWLHIKKKKLSIRYSFILPFKETHVVYRHGDLCWNSDSTLCSLVFRAIQLIPPSFSASYSQKGWSKY